MALRCNPPARNRGEGVLQYIKKVTCLTADPGVGSLIQSQTFAEIDHDIISTAILLPSLIQGFLSVTSESISRKKIWVR